MERDNPRLANLRHRLRTAREAAGLSQRDVARAMGLSVAGYGNMERGRYRVGLHHLMELATILRTSLEYLLDIETGLNPDEERFLSYYRSLPTDHWKRLVTLAVKNLAETAAESPEAVEGTPATSSTDPAETGAR